MTDFCDRERMVGRRQQHQRLGRERQLVQTGESQPGVGCLRCAGDEGEIDLPLAHPPEQVAGSRLCERDLHLAVPAVESLDEFGHVDRTEALLGADAQ